MGKTEAMLAPLADPEAAGGPAWVYDPAVDAAPHATKGHDDDQ